MSFDSDEIAQRKQWIGGMFGRAASTYDHVGPPFFSHFGKHLVDIAKISPSSNVLDVATGRGALLFPAAEAVGRDGQVVGVDLSEAMIQETSKELARQNMSLKVAVRQMDAENLQFSDESFDYVLCGFAIFFFPQLNRAMSEFYRVLKPNGHICVSTWDTLFYEQWGWFDALIKEYLPPEPTPSEKSGSTSEPVFDTPEGLESILASAGFENIQIFSEAKEFVYSANEDYWLSLWSHGAREVLEKIEQVRGKEGLARFRSDVFREVEGLRKEDGLHQMFSTLIGLANKPQT